ncbi:MAG TPA: adenylate/guanylate cyclase domain-containing protein [Chloroflexota bacterium]|nr:adenylate/guanylate cyclase domain-containing protein [Chloroflexota bacterium]
MPLPTGTVTFLFTDIEGSTRLWEADPESMRQALIHHDRLIDELVHQHAGTLVRPRGECDSRFAVFPSHQTRWPPPAQSSAHSSPRRGPRPGG